MVKFHNTHLTPTGRAPQASQPLQPLTSLSLS